MSDQRVCDLDATIITVTDPYWSVTEQPSGVVKHICYRCARSSNGVEEWTATTTLEVGQRISPVGGAGHRFDVTVAGTTGATEPTWPADLGEEVTDGTVTYLSTAGPLSGVAVLEQMPSTTPAWNTLYGWMAGVDEPPDGTHSSA